MAKIYDMLTKRAASYPAWAAGGAALGALSQIAQEPPVKRNKKTGEELVETQKQMLRRILSGAISGGMYGLGAKAVFTPFRTQHLHASKEDILKQFGKPYVPTPVIDSMLGSKK